MNYIDMQIEDACTCVGVLETVFHKSLFNGDVREGLGAPGMISIFPAEIICPESPSEREISRFLRKAVITKRDIGFVGVGNVMILGTCYEHKYKVSYLMVTSGKSTPMVIDSGSNITLILSRLIEHLLPPVKTKEGQSIKINQVTGRSTTNQYLPLKVHFSMSEGPIAMDLKAYLIKDMNTPLILGNDYVDQYLLSILRNNSSSVLQLGDTGRTVPLKTSMDSLFLKVHTLHTEVMKKLHWRSNRT
jgi:hypothetical protein